MKLELLLRAGYRWRGTPPEGFWRADKNDLIEYQTALDATFSDLSERVAQGKP